MILASAIGTLPVESISANTIAGNIDSITYQCMNGFTSSVMTFAGQNYGAMKKDRIWKCFVYTMIQVSVIGIGVGQLQLAFSEPIINMFIASDAPNKAAVFTVAKEVMKFLLTWYPLCGIMGAIGGFLRGIGFSTAPMVVSVSSVLIVRLTWIYVFFPSNPTSITWLYWCYPLTWILAILMDAAVLIYAAIKLGKMFKKPAPESEEVAAL